jgi:hypothetical protein
MVTGNVSFWTDSVAGCKLQVVRSLLVPSMMDLWLGTSPAGDGKRIELIKCGKVVLAE